MSNNKNKFFAIDSRNGLIKWEQSINSNLEPTIIENLALTVSIEGYLFVIDKLKGNILRSTYILGNFNTTNVSLNLSNLSNHDSVRLTFDLCLSQLI